MRAWLLPKNIQKVTDTKTNAVAAVFKKCLHAMSYEQIELLTRNELTESIVFRLLNTTVFPQVYAYDSKILFMLVVFRMMRTTVLSTLRSNGNQDDVGMSQVVSDPRQP